MHDRGFKRWVVLGVVASASWLASACGALPQQAGNDTYSPGFVRAPDPVHGGYNGTIKDIPTSIDPRTPQAQGTPGRTISMDLGERALLQRLGELGVGGSGPSVGGVAPGERLLEQQKDEPAALSTPGESFEPSGANARPVPNITR